jgi:hypothetical protein
MDIPDDWTPTAEKINALPAPLRAYIQRLETEADPAETIRQNVQLKDQVFALEALLAGQAWDRGAP